ncbi:MAG: efflux RND transporter periplasmic adaptor subunit [Saprospiraceae bacterium]
MQIKKYSPLFIFFIAVSLYDCHQNKEAPAADPAEGESGTPVTLTSVTHGPMKETIELNATSAFQLKTLIKANATGYLQSVNTQLGKYINKGQEIFTIKTKEAEAIGNVINKLDSSFQFSGLIHIKAPGSGFVTTLNYRAGDYVQDGEALAEISDRNSFAFILDLPYELKPYLNKNKDVKLRLADGTVLSGKVASIMPSADLVSQTQQIVIKVNTQQEIPENLIAKITLTKESKSNTNSLPKEAILADEVQSEFWVMKLIDSTTAVKVRIEKGLENEGQVEIRSPAFSLNDQILLTGNYGLPDTAKVVVVHQ